MRFRVMLSALTAALAAPLMLASPASAVEPGTYVMPNAAGGCLDWTGNGRSPYVFLEDVCASGSREWTLSSTTAQGSFTIRTQSSTKEVYCLAHFEGVEQALIERCGENPEAEVWIVKDNADAQGAVLIGTSTGCLTADLQSGAAVSMAPCSLSSTQNWYPRTPESV